VTMVMVIQHSFIYKGIKCAVYFPTQFIDKWQKYRWIYALYRSTHSV